MRWQKFIFAIVLGLIINFNANSAEKEYKREPSFYDTLPAVKKGGVLNFKISSDPKVMNPVLSTDGESRSVEELMWMSLLSVDPESLQFLPSLATGFRISADEKNYTFYLNQNAKWQDGTDVTADDFKFTFDTTMNPKVNAAATRSFLSGITLEIKDKYTLIYHVSEPRFDTLLVLSSQTPIQKKQFENSKNFNKDQGIMHPIGNGPFILSKYERGNKISFSRNKNWWGSTLTHYKSRYNIDEINLYIIADNNLAYEKFINGNIDDISFTAEQWNTKVTGLDKDKFAFVPDITKKVWGLKVDNKFPKPYAYVAWNEKNEIFKSVKTRMALSYLVNYQKIIEKVFYNFYIQCTSPFGSLTANSAPELRQPDKIISYNKKKALDLLKQDGWKNEGNGSLEKIIDGKSVPFIFDFYVPSQAITSLKIAQILKEDFKSSGIILNIKSLEWNSFLDKVENKTFDALIMAWSSSIFPNPKQIWDSGSTELGGSNFISYSNPKVDELIAQANVEFNPQKRTLILQNINRLIYSDQPYTFLAEPKYVFEGLSTRIKSPKWYSQYEGGAASDLFYLD